jgi:hypothetical protein
MQIRQGQGDQGRKLAKLPILHSRRRRAVKIRASIYPAHNSWDAVMDLGNWLRNQGLERFEAAFRDNGIDESVLPHLTQDNLRELGLPVGGPDQALGRRCRTGKGGSPTGHGCGEC